MESKGLQRHCADAQARRNMSTSTNACTRTQAYRFMSPDTHGNQLKQFLRRPGKGALGSLEDAAQK